MSLFCQFEPLPGDFQGPRFPAERAIASALRPIARPSRIKYGFGGSAADGLLGSDLGGTSLEPWIKLAGVLPAQHVERFDELADTVDFGTKQAKLDDLLVA